ncbi:MAG: hypothetical protein ABIS69_04255 [Sediminibacterium sp.]
MTFVCMICLVFFSCTKTINQPEQVVIQVSPASMTPYDESRIMRLPGNYQGWNVATAPRVVSPNGNGEFEGYVNFSNPQSQFYLVKGTAWDNVTTYNQTGPASFGFNGDFFFVREGAGVYKVNVNMNTHLWSCTKIMSWGLRGSACSVSTDAVMSFDQATMSWSVTKNLVKGDVVFRANESEDLVLGHNIESAPGIPDYKGEKIGISETGKYTVVLSLASAGNYRYSITKIN